MRRPHSLPRLCLHLHLHARIFLTLSCRLYRSRLEPLRRTSLHRSRRLCTLSRAVLRIVGTRLSRLPRRFQGLLRLFTSRMLTPLRVHALPLFSHAWLLLFCPTRDRHLLRPRSLPSVMAITGAASALVEASPPSLVSCAMLRTSTRAPLWMRPPAPCSRRSNESPARLPPVVASEEWAWASQPGQAPPSG